VCPPLISTNYNLVRQTAVPSYPSHVPSTQYNFRHITSSILQLAYPTYTTLSWLRICYVRVIRISIFTCLPVCPIRILFFWNCAAVRVFPTFRRIAVHLRDQELRVEHILKSPKNRTSNMFRYVKQHGYRKGLCRQLGASEAQLYHLLVRVLNKTSHKSQSIYQNTALLLYSKTSYTRPDFLLHSSYKNKDEDSVASSPTATPTPTHHRHRRPRQTLSTCTTHLQPWHLFLLNFWKWLNVLWYKQFTERNGLLLGTRYE